MDTGNPYEADTERQMGLSIKLMARWMLQQRDLFACSQPCIVQMDAVANRLALCTGAIFLI